MSKRKGEFDYNEWKRRKIDDGTWVEDDEFKKRTLLKKERELKELKRKWGFIELKSHTVLLTRTTRSHVNREIILDCETTGFWNSDGIVELSLLEVIDKKLTGNYMHCLFNPVIEISEGAENIHKLSNEDLKDKPLFEDVSEKIIKFINNSKMVAHNSNFDMRMLNNELNRCGWKSYEPECFIDTLKMARKLYPDKKNTLDCLCDRLNVDNSKRKKTGNHNALDDTYLLFEVYNHLLTKMDHTHH